MALAAAVLEQDAAYWEVHVESSETEKATVKLGVATKKDRKFYNASNDTDEGTNRVVLQ